MREYEIYLPTTGNDGSPVDPGEVDRIKTTLKDVFGGYPHLKQRNEGVWRMGAVTFQEEVTILRVLDDGSAKFDMLAFKKSLEQTLDQETVLIIGRHVEAI